MYQRISFKNIAATLVDCALDPEVLQVHQNSLALI